MGISKTEMYSEAELVRANQFKALGHPARLAIVAFLLKQKDCICNDIVNELPLAQPTISQHLKELKNAGIIQGTIEGKTICYCINPKVIQDLVNYFQIIVTNLPSDNQCCP
jgi:DNA-binding transcriptional ArsR family regulator